MDSPKYDVGTVVYLKESAALGYIEPVKISGILRYQDSWVYTITNHAAQPRQAQIYGDRYTQIYDTHINFTENELLTLCDALDLAEANALRTLQKIQDQKALYCSEETE